MVGCVNNTIGGEGSNGSVSGDIGRSGTEGSDVGRGSTDVAGVVDSVSVEVDSGWVDGWIEAPVCDLLNIPSLRK